MPRAFGNRLKRFPFRRTSQSPVKATVLMRSHEHPKRNPERPFTSYEEFFPDVESAERALAELSSLHIRNPHMALTDRAFERTPAARLGNRPVTDAERVPYLQWTEGGGEISDRSALLMLGIR